MKYQGSWLDVFSLPSFYLAFYVYLSSLLSLFLFLSFFFLSFFSFSVQFLRVLHHRIATPSFHSATYQLST